MTDRIVPARGGASKRAAAPSRSYGTRSAAGFSAVLLAAILAATAGLAADTAQRKSTAEEQKSVAVTVYNNDLALVKDVRDIELPKGVLDLKFEGVAARIDPTSVHIRSLTDPGRLAVLEQNFEYDLISPAKLMEKYVGRTVELVTLRDEEEIRSTGKLIGIEGGYVYEMDGKIAVNPPGRVVLPELPEGLIARPTLVWMLENGAGAHTVEASYLTGGIGWKSDYVLVLSKDDSKIDVSGWVTIDNRSGTTYEDASIKLVAGDVHRVEQAPRMMDAMEMKTGFARGAAPQFEEQAFFEYHLYTLQRKSTLRDNQTKQIGLLEAADVSVAKSFVYQPAQQWWFASMPGPDKSTKIGVYLSVENSKKNGMGMPLPKGLVRVYKKDADESLQFVGEDAIDHTPEDEKIRVKIGDAFDVVGERVQSDYRVLSTGNLYESSYKITLRNHKDERIVVQVVETVPGDWTMTKKSHEYVKEASDRARFDIPVEKKGEAELTYTVQIKY
jgi:hypothetical protein